MKLPLSWNKPYCGRDYVRDSDGDVVLMRALNAQLVRLRKIEHAALDLLNETTHDLTSSAYKRLEELLPEDHPPTDWRTDEESTDGE